MLTITYTETTTYPAGTSIYTPWGNIPATAPTAQTVQKTIQVDETQPGVAAFIPANASVSISYSVANVAANMSKADILAAYAERVAAGGS